MGKNILLFGLLLILAALIVYFNIVGIQLIVSLLNAADNFQLLLGAVIMIITIAVDVYSSVFIIKEIKKIIKW
jgi:hypothetical protein